MGRFYFGDLPGKVDQPLIDALKSEDAMKIIRAICYSSLLLFAPAASAQQPVSQPPKEHTAQTKVVLLGTGTPVPDPDHSGPATAIVVGDSAYLVADLHATVGLQHFSAAVIHGSTCARAQENWNVFLGHAAATLASSRCRSPSSDGVLCRPVGPLD